MHYKKRGSTRKSSRKIKKIPHQQFWLTLIIIFALSSMVILSSVNRSSLTGNAAIQNIALGKTGTELFFEIRNVPCLKDATITTFKNTVTGGKIVFEEDQSISFSGTAVCKITVSSPDAENLGPTILTLRIKNSDLQDKGVRKEDVSLYINGNKANAAIKKLPLGREEVGHTYYTATIELSEFNELVVGKAKDFPPPPVAVVRQELPIADQGSTSPEEQDTSAEESIPPSQELPLPVPVIGRATEEPPSESTKGLWSKITLFFKDLFW